MCMSGEKGAWHSTGTRATSQLGEAGSFIKQNIDGGGQRGEAVHEEEGLVAGFRSVPYFILPCIKV